MCISACLLKIKIMANSLTFSLILRLLLVCLMWNRHCFCSTLIGSGAILIDFIFSFLHTLQYKQTIFIAYDIQ